MATEDQEFEAYDVSNHKSIRTSFSNWKFSFRNKRKLLDRIGRFALFGWGTTGTRICTEIALIEGDTIAELDFNEAVDYDASVRVEVTNKLEAKRASKLCTIYSAPIEENENIIPASRNFLFSLCLSRKMGESGAHEVGFENQITKSKLTEKLKTKDVQIQFHIFGVAGGTGSGILRYILSDKEISDTIKNDGNHSFIPIAILPGLNKTTDKKYALVNAISTYGYMKRENVSRYFKHVIFIDNTLLAEHSYVPLKTKEDRPEYKHEQQNANMAHIMRTLFHSHYFSSTTEAIGGSLKGFDQKYTTFGYGSTAYLNDGVNSTKKAFEKALKNNLLGYEFHKGSEKCSVIVFINVPHRAQIKNIEDVLEVDHTNNVDIVGSRISTSYSYTVDIVLWICGPFESYIDDAFKRMGEKEALREYAIDDWYKKCKGELIDKKIVDVGEKEAEQLCTGALKDFNEVIGISGGFT